MNYPDKVTQGRLAIEGCVIGVIMHDILAIKEYKLRSDMFITEEGGFLFQVLKVLSDNNVMEITDTDIRLYLNEDLIDQYKRYGGMKTLIKLKSTVDKRNAESYIDNLNKRNIMMSLCDDGHDLEKVIKIETKKKTIEKTYLEVFETMDSSQILKFMHNRISNLEELAKNPGVEEMNSEITDDFIDRLREGMEQGTSFSIMGKDIDGNDIYAFPYISNQLQGFKKKTLNQISGHTNIGKSTVLASIAMSMVYNGEKVLFISNEMGCDDFRLNFLSLIINKVLKNVKLHRKKLKSGQLTDEDVLIIKKAQAIFNEIYAKGIDIVSIAENDIDIVEKFLRKYSLGKGTTCLIFDVFKMNFKKGDANYLSLIEDSLKLESLVKTYNVIGISSMQLALNSKSSLRLNCQHLSNAKGVSEILTSLITIRGLNEVELNPKSKYYCRPFKYVKDETSGKWKQEEIDNLDPNAVYRVFEIAKSRSCETSEDSGICVLYKFFGGSGSFNEVCLCKPPNLTLGGGNFEK